MRPAVLCAVASGAVLLGTLPSAPTRVTDWDTVVKLQVARNFAEGRGAVLTERTPNDSFFVHQGRGGQRVSHFPVLATLGWLPTYWVEQLTGRTIAGLPTLLALAFLAAQLVALGLRCGASQTASLAGALLACLGTSLWPSCALEYDSIADAVALAALLWAAAGSRQRDWAVAGAIVGLAFCVRPSVVAVAPAMALLAFLQRPREDWWRRLALAGACALPGLLLTIAWSLYRFGVPYWVPRQIGDHLFSPLSSDYWRAAAGLLISPGKSVFLYSPVLLGTFFAARAAHRRWPLVTLGLGAFLATAPLFYARFDFWHGDWAWGPRYLMSWGVAAAPLGWLAVERLAAAARPLQIAGACAGLALVAAQAPPLILNPVGIYLNRVAWPLHAQGRLKTTPLTDAPARVDTDELYFTPGNAPLPWLYATIASALGDPEEGRPFVLARASLLLVCPLAAALSLLLLARARKEGSFGS